VNASEGLRAFAAAVLERAAKAAPEHRFGRKCFLAAIEPSRATAALLIEAHREGLLILSRLDLISAFDPHREMVAASEIEWSFGPTFKATFHLVEPPR
jgi:hypothetical protein